jgi:Asp-tRNA(Asn)/Glu-tRNA(Gln) amidotransferase A subunit family amidase
MEKLFLNHSIPELLSKIESMSLSPDELILHSAQMFEKYEKDTEAWTTFKKDSLNQNKRELIDKNLFGIPFGAKDIFNTVDFPTEMGSVIWKNFTPGNNARVLDSLLNSGAVLMGKTVTAEFAVHELNKTINPHNNNKTPGTSSSGSAAAVSTGMVPFALGSQTAGSIIRPASFCGVWGYKPSFGLIPRTGVLKTTDSLDTIGLIASHGKSLRSVLDVIRVKGPNYPFVHENIEKFTDFKTLKNNLNIGFIKIGNWDETRNYVKDEIDTFAKKLSRIKNINLEIIEWPKTFPDPHEVHNIIYTKSLGYYFKREKEHSEFISDIMLNMMEKSEKISSDDYRRALKDQENLFIKFNNLINKYDFLFTSSTSSSAPDRSNIKLKDSSLVWTLLHFPSISVPLFRCPDGLPFGLQFISKKWSDYNLLSLVEELIDLELFPSGSTEIIKINEKNK